MKYTLFVFRAAQGELDSNGVLYNVGDILREAKKHQAEISCGVYVFETQKGWRHMHRLRSVLMSRKIDFVELPFEEGLAGSFVQATRDKLRAIGINDDALFNLAE